MRFTALVLFVVTGLVALSQPTPRFEFEVASVKPNHSGRQGTDGFEVSHGSLTVRNVSLKTLIEAAYQTQAERIAAAPAWAASDRFDVIAKGRADAGKDQVWLMLRSLLSDRFQLVLRNDMRELPFFALEIAKDASKLPKGSDAECESPSTPAATGGGFTAPCGGLVAAWGPQGGVLIGSRVSLPALADELSGLVGRPVVDRTGLKGTLNVDLRWTPEGYASRPAGDGEARRSPAPVEPGPSIFSALQEQLGLKLSAAKGPLQVRVVERAEKPSEN